MKRAVWAVLAICWCVGCGDKAPPTNSPSTPTTPSGPANAIVGRPPVRNCGCAVCSELAPLLAAMPQVPLSLGTNPTRGDHAARDALAAFLTTRLAPERFRVAPERGFPGAGRSFDVVVFDTDDRPVALFEIETREEIGTDVAEHVLQRTREQWIELAEICGVQSPPVAFHLVVPADWRHRAGRPDWGSLTLADGFVFAQEDPTFKALRENRGLLIAVWAWGW